MPGSKARKKPNIVLINCDDLGYGDLGCYGSVCNSTPFIDRLAVEGVRFTDFYMGAPVCTPSRAAMMTGCYPPRISFGDFEGRVVLRPGSRYGLNPEEITIAKLLKDAGYATRIVGKWHCGDQPEFLPTRFGFDGYHGLPYSNDMGRHVPSPVIPQFAPLPLMKDEEVIQAQPDQASLTERYVEDAVLFMKENRNRPFFLYFAHMYVHLPLYIPAGFLERSRNGHYGAAVECIDWATGVIMATLEEYGLGEDTLVIFTSDNGSLCGGGGGSNGVLRGLKGSTWEGGQRLPCIMRWPKRLAPGKVCGEIASAMDFYPTLAEIAGATLPGDRVIDGKDISGLMFDPEAESPHTAFFYYRAHNLEAVRSGKWKLHLRKRDREIKELYDLESDIGESRTLYKDRPQIVSELIELATHCRRDMGDAAEGIEGRNVRPVGRVESPITLTRYDPDYPYVVAEYDLYD